MIQVTKYPSNTKYWYASSIIKTAIRSTEEPKTQLVLEIAGDRFVTDVVETPEEIQKSIENERAGVL